MAEGKFDQLDRERVIQEVEQHLGITLTSSKSHRSILTDTTGGTFVVKGGYKAWHHFPKELVEDRRNGTLVMAHRINERIKVFIGPLALLTHNSHKLRFREDGNFDFNVEWKQDRVLIKKIPGAHLQLFCEFAYTQEEKNKYQNIKEVKRFFAKLAPARQDALLASIAKGSW